MASSKADPCVEVAHGNCATCHTTDDTGDQPNKGAGLWVTKIHMMAPVQCAPISDEDARAVARFRVPIIDHSCRRQVMGGSGHIMIAY